MTASGLAAASMIWIVAVSAQTATPPAITLPPTSPVCAGGSVIEAACIQLPPASAVPKVDVFLLLDDTGSFSNNALKVAQLFGSLVTDLETALPGVELGFGVGRFEDYGGDGAGFANHVPEGRPFILNQPIVTAGDAGGADARNALIVEALGRSTPANGGDDPETALEALHQVATGVGFDGNGDGSTRGDKNAQPAGSPEAQLTPDGTGDVPAFSSLVPSVVHSGSVGGAGFRPDALRLVLLATDICTVTAFEGPQIPIQVSGVGGPEPVADFACAGAGFSPRFGLVSNAKSLDANTVDGAVVPSGGAILPATIAALNAGGIRVLGLFPAGGPVVEAAAAPPGSGPSDDPDVFLSALARLTGAVDAMGNPLVFEFDASTTGEPLKNAIVDAVVSAISTTSVDVTLAPGGSVPAGLGVSVAPPVVPDVPPGGQACFEVTFLGSGAPNGAFQLDFKDAGTGGLLGTIPVSVGCLPPTTTTTLPAPCGDGNVDPERGEQCDAGAANGAPGSCCDAACHIVAAGTVCRAAGAACDADAVCDGASAACPANAPKPDGALCDDGDPATGLSACAANVCRGVGLTMEIDPEITAPGNLKKTAISVVCDRVAAGTAVQFQTFLACGDQPALGDCSTKACRRLQRKLDRYCPALQDAVTFARKAQLPAGFVPVTKRVAVKFKRAPQGEVEAKLKLNKLGRALLARSTALTLQTRAQVQERQGSTLNALFNTLLRRL